MLSVKGLEKPEAHDFPAAADYLAMLADLTEIEKGQPLSPILLVRGDLSAGAPPQVADGYPRVCASYHADENTDIPVVIAAVSR
ncbi:hypothetical protein KXD96_01955 [Mycobacterium sp. SMC-2]|uniref:hypothetical protein n=1 Tax=Mycobacterium sp. SMC-2 TaxID=2857058 RepID=UPI0021B3D180|nr:hypothetical protein [Mycobacterium sp. SMC-2]UXA06961.1 hypothetical protein KXD96_01955 [Mycobacterium sp. SMC-2]